MLTVIEKLEKTSKENMNKIAVKCEKDEITYKDLLKVSKKIGSYLVDYIKINDPVIVFMNKGINAVESFLGILYAGGCYSLVNPEFPKKRINQIRDVLKANVILTNDETYDLAIKLYSDCKVVNISETDMEIKEEQLEKIKKMKLDIDPVYINFTSGSTGIPKGVVISNNSIIDFINEFTEKFNITDSDIIANQAPFDFDVSVKDIYSAFFKGATLLIIPKSYFSNPSKLLDYIIDNKATTLIWAVSALCLITTFHGLDYKVPTSINKIIFSGEVMPLKHLDMWMNKLKDTLFVNVYGPTEITCNCTYHIVDRKRTYNDMLPIGIPFSNERVFLLDDKNNIISKEDEMGEICVSGTCVSLGYYNDYNQTEKHFIQNPLNNMYFERIYKTGDYGKYNSNNELVFCGRKDLQIKYMGHRIELEEIDKEIMRIEGVDRASVIYDEKKSKLYGFYVGKLDAKDLKITLMNHLPIYMVPSKIINIPMFPLTKNGKIDRKELLEKYSNSKYVVQ